MKIIELGFNLKDETKTSILYAVNGEWNIDLRGIMREIMEKAEPAEMNQKLIALESK